LIFMVKSSPRKSELRHDPEVVFMLLVLPSFHLPT